MPMYMRYVCFGLIWYTDVSLFGASRSALFLLMAVLIMSFYGGGFATVPAYLRDLFGTYQVGAIHGRLLTAWSVAGVAGPLIVTASSTPRASPAR
jgi:hypothetical protein